MPIRSLTAIAQMCSDCNGKRFPHGMPAMEEDTIKLFAAVVREIKGEDAI
jgi:hypothetical protein